MCNKNRRIFEITVSTEFLLSFKYRSSIFKNEPKQLSRVYVQQSIIYYNKM